MARRPFCSSSTEKLLVIAFSFLAVISPLYVDRKPLLTEPEPSDEPIISFYCLPLLLVFLMVAIVLSGHLDSRFTRCDPYWIHRVGGSSCGIVALLVVLAFVLKLKASMAE